MIAQGGSLEQGAQEGECGEGSESGDESLPTPTKYSPISVTVQRQLKMGGFAAEARSRRRMSDTDNALLTPKKYLPVQEKPCLSSSSASDQVNAFIGFSNQ